MNIAICSLRRKFLRTSTYIANTNDETGLLSSTGTEAGLSRGGRISSNIARNFLQNCSRSKKWHERVAHPRITLIRPEELHAIRRIWRMERGDWKDTVPGIYRECTGEDLEWIDEDLGTYSGKEAALLESICAKHKVPFRLVTKLLDVEFQVQGMSRRSLVYSRIGSVLGEEWRSEDEIVHDADDTTMIITKLVVQNIGLFQGTHVFDLRPCQDNGVRKPIVLIGGKNGAGKTTLFQAIRLCLYGNNISSFKRRKRDYDHYIGGIFHRVSGSSLQLDKASVQLEFEDSASWTTRCLRCRTLVEKTWGLD